MFHAIPRGVLQVVRQEDVVAAIEIGQLSKDGVLLLHELARPGTELIHSLIGSRMHNNPHLQARYDKWQAKLDGIAADWEDYAAAQGIDRPVTTAPRKRARRKAASTPEA